jgi:hypothetical protein
MPTLQQIEANRLNAQKSTGPSSIEGRAAVRFNALKSGIDAQSQVIPGEDPAALELLTAEYHDRYQPATPEVRALVDTLITAEWLQRRFRTLEAQLLRVDIHGVFRPIQGLQVAQAYDRGDATYERLQRRINAVERSFHRALAALQKIESSGPQPDQPREPSPAPQPPAPDPGPSERTEPEIGFVPPTPLLTLPPHSSPATNSTPPLIPTANAANAANAARKPEVPMC